MRPGCRPGNLTTRQCPKIGKPSSMLMRVRVVDGSMSLDERTELEVLPGHTPGGIVVYRHGASTVAICGDAIKNGWDVLQGAPTAAGVDFAAGRESIRHILGRAEIVVPGHERPFTHRGGVVEFLGPLCWRVTGHLLPGQPNDIILDVNLPAGPVSILHKPLDGV